MYSILLPIMVMTGDMPFLNKIVGMVGGQHHAHIYHMCDIKHNDLDTLYKNVILTDTLKIQNAINMSTNHYQKHGLLCIERKYISLIDFYHRYGLNQSTPVEPLHCVLLGLFIPLFQGLN